MEGVMTTVRLKAERILLVVFCFVAIGFWGAPAWAQQQPSGAAQQGDAEGRVVVIGEGTVSVAPDYAEVSGGVTTHGKTVKEATDANTKLMTAITAALHDAGVASKDIQTWHFSIQPAYTPADAHNEAKLSGYTVSNQVNVTIHDIGRVGDILDRLVTAGVTNVGNIQFLHTEPSKLLDQAREAAVADAKRKAEIYAKSSGLKLGPVIWITEDAGYAPPMPMMRIAVAAPAQVPISAGEDSLHVRITVGFATAN
jgi:uncharacterized protein YggE